MEIAEYIYEGFVEPYFKKLPGHITTVMATSGKWEEKPPCQIINSIWVIALSSAEKGM